VGLCWSIFRFLNCVLYVNICPFSFGHCIICPWIYGFFITPLVSSKLS
jgi:hypothetical protein